MQFLLLSGKSHVENKIRLSASYLFQELGYFYRHASISPAILYFPQILCNLSQPTNVRGIHFSGKFDKQLTLIEEAIQSNKTIPVDVEYTLSKDMLLIKGNLLAWIYVMIAHREEELIPESRRDTHDRILFSSSLARSQGWLETPNITIAIHKIDYAVRQFLKLLKTPLFYKNPWPNGKSKAIILSHDIDILGKWILMAAKLAVENLTKRNIANVLGIALSTLKNLLKRKNPVLDMGWMLELEKRNGFVSSFHFLSGQPSLRSVLQADITYHVERVSSLLPLLQQYNVEIALHSSYFTPDSLTTFTKQIKELGMVVNSPIQGVRAHFLRTKGFAFLQAAEKEGLTWDSSEGFADVSGFKTGHTGPYQPVFDDKPMNLWEFPLHWMDRTFSKYNAASVDEIYGAFRKLANQFETFGGVMTLLWHNYTVSDLGFTNYELLYDKMLSYLADADFHNDTVQNLVEWLNQKRSTELEFDESGCKLQGVTNSKLIPKNSDLFQSRVINVDSNTLQIEVMTC